MPEQAKQLKYQADLRSRLLSHQPPVDWPFAILVLIVLAFGLVALFSASYPNGLWQYNDGLYFIRRQALFAVLGLAAMYVASRVDYHIFHRLAWPLMGVTLLLLVVVLFMPDQKGVSRWIRLGPVSVQPSEIAKFAVIVVFAHIISLNYKYMKKFLYGVLPFLLILIPLVGLMILEPHLSGTVLLLAIGAVMMFVGGTGIVWFVVALGGLAGAIAIIVVAFPDLIWYAMDRLKYWIDPFSDPLGKGHQTIQSMYAIGSGGLFGLGLGNSRQKHLYLPEPENDFVFSIWCEEMGFVGAVVVILLFVALMLRGVYIAYKAKDKFGAMLVVGIVAQVIIQAALNIAVVTKTIPNTGISLPFFSYGGSSLVMLLGEMGIVLSVSRQSAVNKT